MDAYHVDLTKGLLWLTGFFGSMIMGIAVWGIKSALARMDEQDAKLEAIRELLQSELTEIRSMHHALDVRVTKIESTCAVVMGNHNRLD